MKSRVYLIGAQRNEGHESLAKKSERIFLQLGLAKSIEKDSFIALKIHFGEKGNTGYIKPQWLAGIIARLKEKSRRVFLTDTSTLYIGNRSNAVDHLHLAWEHQFTPDIVEVPVVIADGLIGKDDEEVKVSLPHIRSAKIASAIVHSDFLLCLSHFTGHIATGLACAIKNLGMGCASRAGKLEQHSDVHPRVSARQCTNCGICLDYCPEGAIIQRDGAAVILDEKCIGCGECLVVCKVGAVKMRWDEDSRRLQEKMAEYAYSVWRQFPGKIGFLNYLMKMTKDCDCMSKDQPTIVDDVGIMASLDPVALDKASVDLVLERSGRDVLRAGYNFDWSIQLRHGAKIGLGSLDYELVKLD